jgi:DNA-binding XRE family transcriptional regulator
MPERRGSGPIVDVRPFTVASMSVVETTRRRLPPADFGPALRALRLRRGWSVRGLAQLAHVSHGYVVNLEHGRRAPSTIVVDRLIGVLRPEPSVAAQLRSAGQSRGATAIHILP